MFVKCDYYVISISTEGSVEKGKEEERVGEKREVKRKAARGKVEGGDRGGRQEEEGQETEQSKGRKGEEKKETECELSTSSHTLSSWHPPRSFLPLFHVHSGSLCFPRIHALPSATQCVLTNTCCNRRFFLQLYR